MLSTEQAEAASKALAQQQAATPSADEREQSFRSRIRFEFVILGMVVGGVFSWFIASKTSPGLAIGMGAGAVIGALLDVRIHRRAYILTALILALSVAVAWYLLRP